MIIIIIWLVADGSYDLQWLCPVGGVTCYNKYSVFTHFVFRIVLFFRIQNIKIVIAYVYTILRSVLWKKFKSCNDGRNLVKYLALGVRKVKKVLCTTSKTWFFPELILNGKNKWYFYFGHRCTIYSNGSIDISRRRRTQLEWILKYFY